MTARRQILGVGNIGYIPSCDWVLWLSTNKPDPDVLYQIVFGLDIKDVPLRCLGFNAFVLDETRRLFQSFFIRTLGTNLADIHIPKHVVQLYLVAFYALRVNGPKYVPDRVVNSTIVPYMVYFSSIYLPGGFLKHGKTMRSYWLYEH